MARSLLYVFLHPVTAAVCAPEFDAQGFGQADDGGFGGAIGAERWHPATARE
jgi:hypothetical protein